MTELANTCPGLSVLTAGWPPGEQSSEDHTLALPDITSRVIAARPMSRLQETDPVFVTVTVSFGFCEEVYEANWVCACTRITESGQRPTATIVGDGEWLTEGVVVGVLVGVVVGVDVPDADGEFDGWPPAFFAEPPPERISHPPTTTSSATTTTIVRLNQYAPGGNDPTGCSRDPTGCSLGRPGRWRVEDAQVAWARARCDDPPMSPASEHPLHAPVLDWFGAHARVLPWREPGVGGWAVLVSEVMLQQTPVARVLPVYAAWMERWPTPAALAADPPGEAVRMWGRLGYPRRALRLHAAAVACVAGHGGEVPTALADLRRLPGVGEYTAAAVASFAYRQRHAVLDTNVRRVLARVLGGQAFEPAGSPGVAERAAAQALAPAEADTAATWAVAVMELGALVCTARNPSCDRCPVAAQCTWWLSGRPAWAGPARRGQAYAGTDRAVRGRLLAVLRDRPDPAPRADLEAAWADADQRERCLEALVADGLVEPLVDGTFTLPR
jgi:A/G-specific adenine glycosylase